MRIPVFREVCFTEDDSAYEVVVDRMTKRDLPLFPGLVSQHLQECELMLMGLNAAHLKRRTSKLLWLTIGAGLWKANCG